MSIPEYLYGISECFIYNKNKNAIVTGYMNPKLNINKKKKKI